MRTIKLSVVVMAFAFATVALLLLSAPASASIIHYNRDYDGKNYQGFDFADPPIETEEITGTAVFTNDRTGDSAVPSNSPLDLANGITPWVSTLSLKGDSGQPGVLTNGVIAVGEMYGVKGTPGASCFFDHGYDSNSVGRIGLDLGSIQPIGQVNTYSWHCYNNNGQRATQRYTLYASDGSGAGFDSHDETAGNWDLVAGVDTATHYGAPRDGQFGVSILPGSGLSLGNYRYFIFVVKPGTGYDGTFYQEIDIVKAVPEPAALALLACGLLGLLAYAWRKRR